MFATTLAMCKTCRMEELASGALTEAERAEGEPATEESDEVELLERVTRLLVGVTLHSFDELRGGEGDERVECVSMPQFRLLLMLNDLGRSPSAKVAEALGLGPSSVTRLADRLCASGHLVRGGDPSNRSVVTIELTARGRALVRRVVDRRHATLAALLAPLDPAERATLGAALRHLLLTAERRGDGSDSTDAAADQLLDLAVGVARPRHR